MALLEMVKNIYDHGQGRGSMFVSISSDGLLDFVVEDFGPGYYEKGKDTLKEIANYHANWGSSIQTPYNYGVGLMMIYQTFELLRNRISGNATWEIQVQGRFRYEGRNIYVN
jgi:uncharacterized protein (DUF2164 family)